MRLDMPFISVVIPCYNEVKFVEQVFQNVLEQDYPSERMEVIFSDGMSDDGTRDTLHALAAKNNLLRVIDNPNRYVPSALNLAIRSSKGDIIVRLDAHSEYPSNYVSTLVKAMLEHPIENVGGVWDTQPGADTDEARAIVLATSHPLGIGNASYRLGGSKERLVDTVPFGCFKRSLFDRIGLFDEDLIRNQDDEFNGRIIRSGGKILLLPELKIKYYARDTRKKLSRMFFQYGQFKPLVNHKLGAPATIRQFVPPIFVLVWTLSFVFSFFTPLAFAVFAIITSVYLLSVCLVSARLAGIQKPLLMMETIITFPTIHFSYGIGYISGLYRYTLLKSHLKANRPSVNTSR
jgi:glycosyltransferase involved in cell wall biosynthesis